MIALNLNTKKITKFPKNFYFDKDNTIVIKDNLYYLSAVTNKNKKGNTYNLYKMDLVNNKQILINSRSALNGYEYRLIASDKDYFYILQINPLKPEVSKYDFDNYMWVETLNVSNKSKKELLKVYPNGVFTNEGGIVFSGFSKVIYYDYTTQKQTEIHGDAEYYQVWGEGGA